MLKRKLWRDIRGNWGAYLACAVVLIIGLMLYVSLSLVLDSLTTARDNYYARYGFADGFARIVKGPSGLVQDAAGIQGVDKAVGRIVQEVMVYDPSGKKNTTVRLVSFDIDDQPVNRFKLLEGRIPSEGVKELLVSPAFLKANSYSLGDTIPIVVRGKEEKFKITGTAISPEYVYEIPGGHMLAPDPTAFGVAFVSYETIAPMFDMQGRINDLAFTLEQGTDFSSVKTPMTRLINSYGLLQLLPRKDQLSNSMLTQEVAGLKASATTTPVIFLIVAAAIMYIMLRRMIEQQRGQIGVLKAFGFTEREILVHYLGYPVIIGAFGGITGGLLGSWLSFSLAKLYQQYYNIPDWTGRLSIGYILASAGLAITFGIISGFQGCKRVTRLSPSEAMRPQAPPVGKKTLLEKAGWLWKILSTRAKMAVRNVFRNKQRTIIAILGVACAFSLMVAGRGMFDASYFLISFQYDHVERYDLKVMFREYADKTAGVTAARHVDGVNEAEPILEVPATITHGWLKKDSVVTGLPDKSTLYQLLNQKGTTVSLPDRGIVVSSQLAKTLNLKAGDKVTIKPLVGDKDEFQVQVASVVPQYVGLGAYMQMDGLSTALNSSPVASSVLVKVDPARINDVRKQLQAGSNVLTIQDKTKLKAQFEQLMESSQASQYIILFFSFVLGFAIVYNVNIISLSERERELATLMVIGMTEREIAGILLIEQVLLGCAAIITGIPLSYGMLWAIANASATDIYNMPLVVKPETFIISIIGTALFLLAVQWKVSGKISKFSMLDVLKQQE